MGGGGSSGITVNTTAITGGTSGRVLYDNAGTVGEKDVTGTGSVVLDTSPTLSFATFTDGADFNGNINVSNITIGVGDGENTTLIGRDAMANPPGDVVIGTSAAALNNGGPEGEGNNVVIGYRAFDGDGNFYETVAIGANIASIGGQGPAQSVYIGNNIIGGSLAVNQIIIGEGAAGGGDNSVVLGNLNITRTTLRGVINTTTYTVATLPAGQAGSRAFITDCTVGTALFGSAPTGGSNVKVPVYHDGSVWRVG